MVSEADLPQFSRGLNPIGTVHGATFATRQQSGPLIKAMKALTKIKQTPKLKTKKIPARRHGKTRNLEADSRVHFGKESFKPSDLF